MHWFCWISNVYDISRPSKTGHLGELLNFEPLISMVLFILLETKRSNFRNPQDWQDMVVGQNNALCYKKEIISLLAFVIRSSYEEAQNEFCNEYKHVVFSTWLMHRMEVILCAISFFLNACSLRPCSGILNTTNLAYNYAPNTTSTCFLLSMSAMSMSFCWYDDRPLLDVW